MTRTTFPSLTAAYAAHDTMVAAGDADCAHGAGTAGIRVSNDGSFYCGGCYFEGDIVAAAPAPVVTAARAPRTYRARRIAVRFFEYTHDGSSPSGDTEDFNHDMTPYATDDDMIDFDSVAELVAAIRRDYVSFDAYRDGKTASDPDGSQIIDYATSARESVSWHLDGISPALLSRVIVPAVDAR